MKINYKKCCDWLIWKINKTHRHPATNSIITNTCSISYFWMSLSLQFMYKSLKHASKNSGEKIERSFFSSIKLLYDTLDRFISMILCITLSTVWIRLKCFLMYLLRKCWGNGYSWLTLLLIFYSIAGTYKAAHFMCV